MSGEFTILEMRETLAEHARAPFGLPRAELLFADNPAEARELLRMLFAEYDDGDDAVEPDIRALIKLLFGSRKYISMQRTAVLKQMDMLRASYNFPPTIERVMCMSLRGVVHANESSSHCESLVREYPEVATELLEQLERGRKHDKLYDVAPAVWQDSTADAATLRAMIARSVARSILSSINL